MASYVEDELLAALATASRASRDAQGDGPTSPTPGVVLG
jgi:hypothetical protein